MEYITYILGLRLLLDAIFEPFSSAQCRLPACFACDRVLFDGMFINRAGMRKGLHPQLQWISYVTPSGRLINVMMTKVHQVGKVYHFRARRQMAQSLGQIAKFKRRYGQEEAAEGESK